MLKKPSVRRKERGYILLTLMLFVSLLAIAALAIGPSLSFESKRDREEEMIHRGVQYSRAIRKYFKKFGRYPTSINDLESSNNLRFLRRRYKDPITNKDFKLLHFGEVQMSAGGGIVGATSAAALAGAPTQNAGGAGGFSLGPTSASASAPGAQPANGAAAATDGGNGTAGGNSASPQSSQGISAGGGALSSQTFGGGPIVGVVSVSKAATIREFNGKNHYDQWQFIYDPSTDRGGLLNTPAQPPLQNAVVNSQPGAMPGGTQMPGAPGNGLGQGQGGFGMNNMGGGISNSPVGQSAPQQPPPQQPAQP